MEAQNISEIIKSYLEQEILDQDESLFLVDVIHSGNSGNSKILILVDADEGMKIEQCSMISRKVGLMLEERDLINYKYTLEVSSPGIDQPLKLKRQYEKNIGRNLKVRKTDDQEVAGKLKEVHSDFLKLEIMESKKLQEVDIAFSEIKKSSIIVSFK